MTPQDIHEVVDVLVAIILSDVILAGFVWLIDKGRRR